MRSRERRRRAQYRTPYHDKFRAYVIDIDDPFNRNRIRARVPRINPGFITIWALPCGLHPNDHEMPSIGDVVWIEFEGGDPRFPIWQYGFKPTGADVESARAFRTTNQSMGRRIIGHPSGSELVIDGTRGNESAFVRSQSKNAKVGVSTRQDSAFLVGDKNVLIKSLQTLIERVAGARDTTIGGNERKAVGGVSQQSIGSDKEETIAASSLRVVGTDERERFGSSSARETVNEAGTVVSGLTLSTQESQDGSAVLLIADASGNEIASLKMTANGVLSEIVLEGSGPVALKGGTGDVTVETTTGNVDVKTASGTISFIGPSGPVTFGVLHGATIDRFTGTPFSEGPGSGSLTVKTTV